MYIVNFVIGLILLIVGIRFKVKKTDFFIKIYKKAYGEDEKQYDEEKFIKVLSNIIILGAIILIISGIIAPRSVVPNYIALMFWGIFILFAFGGFLYMNTEDRFDKSEEED